MLDLSRGLLLRHNWSHISDGYLCSGIILGRLGNCVFGLFSGILRIRSIFIQLLKLSSGDFYGYDWDDCMHGMSRGLVLRHYRS